MYKDVVHSLTFVSLGLLKKSCRSINLIEFLIIFTFILYRHASATALQF